MAVATQATAELVAEHASHGGLVTTTVVPYRQSRILMRG
jgi:hypothetical protein